MIRVPPSGEIGWGGDNQRKGSERTKNPECRGGGGILTEGWWEGESEGKQRRGGAGLFQRVRLKRKQEHLKPYSNNMIVCKARNSLLVTHSQSFSSNERRILKGFGGETKRPFLINFIS